jgi:hypothetical protein
MSRQISVRALRRQAIKALKMAMQQALEAGDFRSAARTAAALARIANQLERKAKPASEPEPEPAGTVVRIIDEPAAG